MAGIYIHIPFCRQACHYCDFHFTTSGRGRAELLNAMVQELQLRSEEFRGIIADSIYFGGGTPSQLNGQEWELLINMIFKYYELSPNAEITVEANPDDLSSDYLQMLRNTAVNRLSIGIQSFRDSDLKDMNRAHSSVQALRCVSEAADAGFTNISVDLIFGWPGLDMEAWMQNVRTAFSMPIQHLSCYGLTVEPRTALSHQISKGKRSKPDDEEAALQYEWLISTAEEEGIPWYEISNFCRPGFESRHNTSYWKGQPYLGIGPSAHSFDGVLRSWNVSNNTEYISGISKGVRPAETEVLGHDEQFHEFILTSLRMRKGIEIEKLKSSYGSSVYNDMVKAAAPFIEKQQLELTDSSLRLTGKGLLIADHITSLLFVI